MPRHDHKPRPWAYVAPDNGKDWGQPDKKADSFYLSARWRKVREIQLQRHPLCKICTEMGLIVPAQIVDHIKPRSMGGADLAFENLQSLCKRHHNIKTKREQR